MESTLSTFRTLHISSGTTLTKNTLYCSPTVKIVVYPGAKLIIDGGILTNICDGELWQGIYVKEIHGSYSMRVCRA